MVKKPVQVRKLGDAHDGYRILAARRKPAGTVNRKMLDAWIPALAPSPDLWKKVRTRRMQWRDFKEAYGLELAKPVSQNLIKPLALLSRRRSVVLLCDCDDHLECPSETLAENILKCRQTGNFRMDI